MSRVKMKTISAVFGSTPYLLKKLPKGSNPSKGNGAATSTLPRRKQCHLYGCNHQSSIEAGQYRDGTTAARRGFCLLTTIGKQG